MKRKVWPKPSEHDVIKDLPIPKCEEFRSRRTGAGWILEHNGQIIATHTTQPPSHKAARKAGRRVRDEGGFACVILHKQDGSIFDTYIYGRMSNPEPEEQWLSLFADPPTLKNGDRLLTLSDARSFINSLSKRRQSQRFWKFAMEALLLTANNPRISTLMAETALKAALSDMDYRDNGDRHLRLKAQGDSPRDG